ncbi:MAG: AMP-binding protein [Clostridia bacterium]|nr:AMP-binding protein [Clostridia bacterium]
MIEKVSTIYGLFHDVAEIQPDHPLYRFNKKEGEVTVTYGEADELLKKMTCAFTHLNVKGKKVIVMGETSVQWITTYVSVVTAGGIIVPFDPLLLEDEMLNFIKVADASIVVYSSSFEKLFAERGGELPNVEYFIKTDKQTFTLDPEDAYTEEKYTTYNNILALGKYLYESNGAPDNMLQHDTEKMSILLFTSGTTGTSKGVMLAEKNVCAVLNGIIPTLNVLTPNDSVLSVLPIHHTYEMSAGILAPMLYGMTVNICDGIKYVGKNIKQFKPSVLALVPMFANQLYKTIWKSAQKQGNDKKLRMGINISNFLMKLHIDVRRKLLAQVHEAFGGRLRYFIVGGAALAPELVDEFKSFGIHVSQGYGITECAPLISVVGLRDYNPTSCGKLMPGMQIYIDKENADDLSGEIVVKGDNVMLGYYNDPEQTAQVLNNGWFRTGDYGYVDEKGYIYITGRKKNIIISSSGKNVFPEEIEEYLEAVPQIAEVVVLGRENQDTKDVEIVAVVFPDEEECKKSNLEGDAIYEYINGEITKINKKLAAYKHISKLEIRNEPFEKTTTRKIRRNTVK